MTGLFDLPSGIVQSEAKVDSQRLSKAKLDTFCWLVLIPACWAALAMDARAADITGAWASDTANCDKIFVKRGNGVALAEEADLYGSGFVIEGRKIKGRTASCDIKTMKEDGATVHLLAACATDIMLSNVQFTLKVVDQNRLMRLFPGMPDIQMPYDRCTFQ